MHSRAPAIEGNDIDGSPAPPWSFDAFSPAGALVSTIEDLLKFAYATLHRLGDVGVAARACLDRTDEVGVNKPLAWVAARNSVFWHNGQTAGNHAMLALRLDTNEAITAAWTAGASLDDICLYALGAVTEPDVYPVETCAAPSQLSAFVGDYAGQLGRFEVTLKDGGLILKGRAYGQYRLYPSGKTKFFAKKVPATYEFLCDEEHNGVLETWGKFPERLAARIDDAKNGDRA